MVSDLFSDYSEQEMHQINFDLCGCSHRFCCSCVVGMETKVWAGWSGAQLAAGWRDFSFLQKCPDTSSILFSGNGGTFSVWEWLGHDADHMSPSSATVDQEWSIPLLSLYAITAHTKGLHLLPLFQHTLLPFLCDLTTETFFCNKRPLHTMSFILLTWLLVLLCMSSSGLTALS
jgi:hypothetical protein